MKYLPKEKMPENLHNKALRAFKNIQNDNWKFVICFLTNIYFSQEKYRKVVYNKKDIEFIKKTQKKFKEKYRKKEKNHE